jgi:hypothetical protein
MVFPDLTNILKRESGIHASQVKRMVAKKSQLVCGKPILNQEKVPHLCTFNVCLLRVRLLLLYFLATKDKINNFYLLH